MVEETDPIAIARTLLGFCRQASEPGCAREESAIRDLAYGSDFQHDAELNNLVQIAFGHLAYAESAVPSQLDQALTFELQHRLSHRSDRNSELTGNRTQRIQLVRLEASGDDARTNSAKGLISETRGIKFVHRGLSVRRLVQHDNALRTRRGTPR